MKPVRTLCYSVAILLMSWPVAGQSLGKFQSTTDNQQYELRRRGETGLDVYTLDGQLIAALNRKAVTEQFKGTTQVLAAKCPNRKGKIETVWTSDNRFQMRVETPQKSALTSQMSCNMLVLARWEQFDLVKVSSSGAGSRVLDGSETTPPAVPSAGAKLDDSYSGVTFHVDQAVGEGKTLIVVLTAVNTGLDRALGVGARANGWGCRLYKNGPGVEIVDESANKFAPAAITVSNQESLSELLNGLATRVSLRFDNLPTMAGTLAAKRIVRLQVGVQVGEGAGRGAPCGTLEFRNIPIETK